MATRRILSIDGGGIRGVFSAAIIEQMEIAEGTPGNPKPAWKIFDCFVGTSAGSILAAGLAAGIPAGKLKQIFIAVGEGMSMRMKGTAPPPSDEEMEVAVRVCGLLYPEKTDLSELSSAEQASLALACVLEPLFKDENGRDKLPSDLKRRLAVVTRNMEFGKVVFFGNFPKDQLDIPSFWDNAEEVDERDDPVWRMVLRSAALPPFFAPAGPYLDGGVSPFANPCYAAYLGVQRRLGWNPHEEALRFYSVGTGYHNVPVPPLPKKLSDLDDTALMSAMVDAMMQDINFLQHQIMKRQKDERTIWYKRYNISFDKTGFEKYGLDIASFETTFEDLASTDSPDVANLAKIGEAVGKASLETGDFDGGPKMDDRRQEDVGYEPKSRRVLTNVTSHSADPSDQAASAAS